MKRGQASFEYIILIGMILVLIIPLFYYAFTTSSEDIKLSEAEDLVQTLTRSADDVYALSPGSVKYVWVTIPGSVQKIAVNTSEISVTLTSYGETSEVVGFTRAPLVGTLDSAKGTYRVRVEHLDSGAVLIGTANDTTDPYITWKSPTALACNPVVMRVNTNEPATCKYDETDTTYDVMASTMSGSVIGHDAAIGVQPENNYTYYVRCKDAFNNKMSASEIIAYTIDLELCADGQSESDIPIVTLLSPSSGSVVNTSQIDFSYNVSDASVIATCELIADSTVLATAVSPPTSTSNTLTGNLDSGAYNWSVSCTDAFGNQGNSTAWEITVNATLDLGIPIVNLEAPVNQSVRNFNLVKFFYNTSDATSTISSCSLNYIGNLDDGTTTTQAVTDFSVSENQQEIFSLTLNQGNYTWNVSCKDNSIYYNQGWSEQRWLRVNSSTESFIISCAGQCGYEGFSDGVCKQSPSKCTQDGETHSSIGDQYCTGGAQSDTCCCVP